MGYETNLKSGRVKILRLMREAGSARRNKMSVAVERGTALSPASGICMKARNQFEAKIINK